MADINDLRFQNLAYKAYQAHQSAMEQWRDGYIKEAWVDDGHYLCIRYESGRWWHYDIDKSGNWIWW